MRHITKFFYLFSIALASTSSSQAATTFLEGARDTVTIHPSCRTENTGLTAVGVALPVGPVVKATMDDENKTTMMVTFPYPAALISTDRRGNVFNGNPIMGARPSYNQAAMFGTATVQGTVATYGSKEKTEDTKMAFWKVKSANSYDLDSYTLSSLAYIPAGEFVTVELGFALPKFAPDSCIAMIKVQGAQFACVKRTTKLFATILKMRVGLS